jgi:hypothetical protein
MASSIYHLGNADFSQEQTFAPGFTNATFVDATSPLLQTSAKSVRASRLTKADVLETPVFCRMLLS